MNYKFYITNLYVNYFKSICQIIATKSIVKKKLNDAAELNEYNLKNKIFRKFKENTELQQIKNGVILRRKVLRRVFLNNIISLFVSVYKINYQLYTRKKNDFYRKLHLRKYFYKRWKRTLILLKNIKIANLKFICKFIIMWRKSIMTIKKDKIYFYYLLDKFLSDLNSKHVKIYLIIFRNS